MNIFVDDVSYQILNWSENKKIDSLLDQYSPNRPIKTWGKIDDACKYFASSTVSNLLEHKIIKTIWIYYKIVLMLINNLINDHSELI